MALRINHITMDCTDPEGLAGFWTEALGYNSEVERPGEQVWLEDPLGKAPNLLLIRVPETKAGKNRLHLDIIADDMDAEVERLTSLGATKVELVRHWTVMRDPEGNEYCVIRIPPQEVAEEFGTLADANPTPS